MSGDGDGWVRCQLGHRHWGRFGAAGLLLSGAHPGRVVLQHRAFGTHEGGTWALPGGARDSHEDPVQGALREAGEEAGISAADVSPAGLSILDHGGWSYITVVADAVGQVHPHAANWESVDVRWCAVEEVASLPLHPAFATAWTHLQKPTSPLTVIVDAANVIGARPDGWWRDRAGATMALHRRILRLARGGVSALDLPAEIDAGALDVLLPRFVLVVEGAATSVGRQFVPGQQWWHRSVDIVPAVGSGDDEVVVQAGAAGQVLVVTADRQLRVRLPDSVARTGPTWLYDRLDGFVDDGP
jgi:8-oxo-dGTP diphosphatase